MRALLEIVLHECRSLLRSKTLVLLTGASVLWVLALPYLVKGDGTPDGLHELMVRFSLGGVLLLLVVTLLASATGALARERTEKRLQLTLVRPVRHAAVVLGKIMAHVAVGAFVLAVACLTVCLKVDVRRPCRHVLSPELPSPREEAEKMYASYIADPSTPPEIKKAKKATVLRILENRAADHYQVIPTNGVAEWRFPVPDLDLNACACAVRMRFTNQFEMRQEFRGSFSWGVLGATVSNTTQAVLTIPLSAEKAATAVSAGEGSRPLLFRNLGDASLMLRPRQDVHVLVAADPFWRNLLRAYAEMVALLAVVVAVGLFLSAGLGRPVALFVGLVLLVVSEMSPSVVEQYPETLESGVADRVGLFITRSVATVTHPLSALSPLEALSKDECVEPKDVARMLLADLLLFPLLLSFVASLILPRKQQE